MMDPLEQIIERAYKVTKQLADKAPKGEPMTAELSYLEGLLESALAIITPDTDAPKKGFFNK